MDMDVQPAFLRALRGEPVRPSPIWVMRQAGRYLPEYRATRQQAGSFLDLCFTPDLAAEVTLQPIRRFGFDAAILFSDILVIPWALGQKVWFEEGVGPRLEPIQSIADIDALRPEELLQKLEPVFEAIRILTRELPSSAPLIGFAGAPWTLMTYMFAGRSSTDQAAAKLFRLEHPEAFERVQRMLEESCVAFLAAQIDAGVRAVKLFDSWAGSLSAEAVDPVCIDSLARIVTALKARAPDVPIIAFPRGLGSHLPRFMARVEADAVALDQSVSMSWAVSAAEPRLALQGNLDPIYLRGPLAPLQAALERLRRDVGDHPHVLNLGHGVTPESKIENVEALVTHWRSLG